MKQTIAVARTARNSTKHLLSSFAQRRFWYLAQLGGVSEAYHISLGLRLNGALDEVALRKSLDRLVVRHETLRTTFYTVDGEVFQRILPENTGFALGGADLCGLGDAQTHLGSLVQEEALTSFDLERGPLIRGRLLRLASEEHVLLITMHHIISDGWSVGILMREFSALYGAYTLGKSDPLEPLAIQYADYAAWQRQWLSGERLAQQSAYWQRALSGAPALIELPLDRHRPVKQEFSGGYVPLVLEERLTTDLAVLCRRHGLTLFMTVLAGWALVLSRLSNQEVVVIGVPVANRGRLEIEGLVGLFVNTLALRIDLSGTPAVTQLLERVKAATLEAQAHQDLPFEQVVDLVKPVRSLNHMPLFQVLFNWQNHEGNSLDLPGLEVAGIGGEYQPTQFDLMLSLGKADGLIVGGLNYAVALFDQATVERYAQYLRKALSEMVRDDRQAASAVALLSTAELHKLFVEWNST